MAHGLNRVAEKVRLEFPDVNNLVSNIKKVFLKAPLRVQLYNEMLPGIPLPPEPILTRWGTWLKCAVFLADNYEGIKNVVTQFDSATSLAIEKCNVIFNNSTIKNQLSYIKSNFAIIEEAITRLEDTNLSLNDGVGIVNDIEEKIGKVNGLTGKRIKEKLASILSKNGGFVTLKSINNVINGNFNEDINISPSLIPSFKNAPITSCDVERTFSQYKHILTDRRHNLTMENLKKYMVIYCNK